MAKTGTTTYNIVSPNGKHIIEIFPDKEICVEVTNNNIRSFKHHKGFGWIYMYIINDYGSIYIGQTTQALRKRHCSHISSDKQKIDHILKKHEFELYVLGLYHSKKDNEDTGILNEREMFYIDLLNTCDCDFPLNLTYGGDSKVVFSEEVIAKKSAIGKKLWNDPNSIFNTPEYREKLKEYHQSSECRRVASNNLKLVWDDPDSAFHSEEYQEYKKNMMKEKWNDPNSIFNTPEYREKLSIMVGKARSDPNSGYHTDGCKQKHSKQSKERWQNETCRSKMIDGITESWKNPDVRKKHSDSMIKAWKNPETRRKHSEATRQYNLCKKIAQGFKLLEEIGGTR